MTRPALLLVPGAWNKPGHFNPLVDALQDFDVHTVTLTSSGDDPTTLGDMYADAAVVAQAVAAIDGPVVVIAHSYGGVPATQALSNAGNVQRIIYLAASQLDVGESQLSPAGGRLMPWTRLHYLDGVGGYVEVATPMTVFYNDVEVVTARDAAEQLGYQRYAAMEQELTEAAWKTVPSTYIICEEDNAIPVAAQEVMAKRADEVLRIRASHSPFLSQPAALARLIRGVCSQPS
ncbi:alpha/beta hydrolase [Mycobacterium sp. NPDC048908]|uniref:alpha/beta hydrolase n=1 Tax=Mycobacterium sp. NPDC048908 TaxID=3364292 RepID=UPI00371C60B5